MIIEMKRPVLSKYWCLVNILEKLGEFLTRRQNFKRQAIRRGTFLPISGAVACCLTGPLCEFRTLPMQWAVVF